MIIFVFGYSASFYSIRAQDYFSPTPIDIKRKISEHILEDTNKEIALRGIVGLSMMNKEWHKICNEKETKKKIKALKKEVFLSPNFKITQKNAYSILLWAEQKNKTVKTIQRKRKILDCKLKILEGVHITPTCAEYSFDIFFSMLCCPPGFCCQERIENDYCEHVKKKYGIDINNENLTSDDFETYKNKRRCTSFFAPWISVASCLCCCLNFFLGCD